MLRIALNSLSCRSGLSMARIFIKSPRIRINFQSIIKSGSRDYTQQHVTNDGNSISVILPSIVTYTFLMLFLCVVIDMYQHHYERVLKEERQHAVDVVQEKLDTWTDEM